MRPKVGQIWKCIDHQDSLLIGKTCRIVEYDDNPDYNGDGPIELLYEDGTTYHGKVRRFWPGITHEYVGEGSD